MFIKKRYFKVLLLFYMLLITIEISSQEISDLFVSGEKGVHTYRIPALSVSVKGTLIAICDARQDKSSDLPGNIDLVMRRSLNNGRSWEPMKYILDLPEGHGCGDPSIIVDKITGRIFCFYAYGPPGIGIKTSKSGTNDANDVNTQHAQYIYSDDDGESWSDPVEMNPMIKEKQWDGLFAASGHGIQTQTGRLLQPYVIRYDIRGDQSWQTHARNAYSDDHGKTWRMGEPAGIQVGETKVVELASGQIMQNMRNRQLTNRSIALSADGGITFSKMWQDNDLIGPRCNASITRYSNVWEGNQYNVLAFSNPASQESRKNMTVKLSLDEGKTWNISIPINKAKSGYSSIIKLYDGSLGLLYENGEKKTYEKISFVTIEKERLDSLIKKEITTTNTLKRHKHHPYYYHSSHHFASLPDTEDEIIFLGNSISDGGEWHELFGDDRMKNRGISGDVVEGILYRLQHITKLKPLKIFLLIGVNDLAKGKSENTITEGIKRICEEIKKESTHTEIYVQSIMPVNDNFGMFKDHTDKTKNIININKYLEKNAKEIGYTYIDLFTPMSDLENKLRKDITEDGLHLNGRGYQIWKYHILKYM